MKFGEKIKELRTQKKMSQTELGKAVGVSLRTVRGWEVEGRYPRHKDLYYKLAEILGCDISYLMSEEESFITEASEQYGKPRRKTGSDDIRTDRCYVCRRGFKR